MTPIEVAQFWGRVKTGPISDCWPWLGPNNGKGYGRYTRKVMAHRVAYQIVCGPIPEGKIILHACDNPPCCNPLHLRAGTTVENSQDAIDRDRIAHSATHGRTKLTPDQVHYIRFNPDRKTGKALAAQFELAESTVSYIRSGRSWSRLVGVTGIEPVTDRV